MNSSKLSPALLERVGAAPISWGICEAPGWGMQLPVERVLSEAQELGITAFEQGALGWLPTEADAQRAMLGRFGMELLGGFVPLVLHDPAQSAAQLQSAAKIAADMAACGGTYFVTAVVGSVEDWFRPEMDDTAWAEVFANLDRLEEICGDVGLEQVMHPHVDTVIETAEEFDRFLESSATKACFDTGHLTIGGADVVALATDWVDRIGVMHLKDVDGSVMARERSGELDLMAATQAGLFPPLGAGIVPIDKVISVVEDGGFDGWYVMETDVALTDGEPPAGEGPVVGVAQSLAYLRTLISES
jgi:inosose dehydratase